MTDPDQRSRCPWVDESTLYRDYHDFEWGRPLHGRDALYERLCLEAFQSGLSWLTILRKREALRAAFDGFDVDRVAAYGASDVDRLLNNPAIVRNSAKINACVHNARIIAESVADFDELLWSFAPRSVTRPRTVAEVPAITAESTAMASELKRRGFKFIGPTTAYALMQAVGMVDDHLADCWVAVPATSR
ncbi:DNA-3-methyladenine glycosylase I [Skermania sp. ID1734]|uniref:DNA-3-methyladenine glycosylase I n=1 Tax=Skermania sp. ID1734 TaxID=2597516 RepID=UPI001180B804|nr:DNA-3-methyladenine glycosylase I [Skermania sp. ID1734]TSE01915.1 DNA-3-methyladenine glycosylase I [Skermania sp. ID1734]